MSDISGLMKVNIRTESIEKARAVLGDVLGAEVLSDRGSDTIGDFDGIMLKIGDVVLDVMAPNDPEGRFAKSLEKRGEGLDSLCFRVESLDAVRERLKASGIELINVRELHGTKIGFIHPKDCCGIVVELIEPAKRAEESGSQ